MHATSIVMFVLLLQQPSYKTVANVAELMKAIIIPASDVIFAAGGETPKTDADWTKLQNNALALAESGNLLLMRPPAKDNANWMKFSREMIDAGEAALKAARSKNANAISEAGDRVYGSCESCHKQYMAQ
jgi:cytochrome c556